MHCTLEWPKRRQEEQEGTLATKGWTSYLTQYKCRYLGRSCPLNVTATVLEGTSARGIARVRDSAVKSTHRGNFKGRNEFLADLFYGEVERHASNDSLPMRSERGNKGDQRLII